MKHCFPRTIEQFRLESKKNFIIRAIVITLHKLFIAITKLFVLFFAIGFRAYL